MADPADCAWMDERLAGHPWKCFEQPLQLANEEAVWAIPQFHILCTSMIPFRKTKVNAQFMEKARAAGRYWEIDTGHDLMITEPKWVADRLIEIAAAPIRDLGAARS